MSEATGAMSGGARAGSWSASGAGLVLLYAPNHAELPAAFPLASDSTVLGREPPAPGIVLPGTAVSRVHARISRRGDRYVVSDLESRNGVLVGGRLVDEAVLEPDADLRIGDAIFKFVPKDIDAYARFRLDRPERAE